MNTYIAYFDETGDDGIAATSSDHFILTSLYMPAESWQQNFNLMRSLRKELRNKYNIQRIENDSDGTWNYLIITDEGRIAPMRKTARAIRSYNSIQSKYSYGFMNQPITNM